MKAVKRADLEAVITSNEFCDCVCGQVLTGLVVVLVLRVHTRKPSFVPLNNTVFHVSCASIKINRQ